MLPGSSAPTSRKSTSATANVPTCSTSRFTKLRIGLKPSDALRRSSAHQARHRLAEVPREHAVQPRAGRDVDEGHDAGEQGAVVVGERAEDGVDLAAEDLARQVRVLVLALRVRVGRGRIYEVRHQLLHDGPRLEAAWMCGDGEMVSDRRSMIVGRAG